MKLTTTRGFVLASAMTLGVSLPAAAQELAIAIHVDPAHAMFKVGERLKKTIEEQTDGEMTVTLLGTEVGGERDHLEGVSYGEYDIALGGSMPMTLYAPKFAAADLPFVYDSSDEARQVYEGDTGEAINKQLVANGNMRLVGLSARNPRNLTSNMPVESPEDIQGVRMRVPEIAPWVKVWEQVGALPSPIAWPEVYTSLQTGVIEMQENPVDLIYAGKLYEVQDYINRTEHVYSFFHWLMNEDFYQGLSDEDREMLLSAIDEATQWGDELVAQGQEEVYQKLKDEGMEVVEPDVAAFREAAKPAVEEIAQGYDPAVRDYVMSLINQ
ncbi:tripartite ATP-independent transporter DctP family solute receptor [Modicisalibacter xianhensis]|uniref:Tripartite ATP-independent transporter DctP family solute receptor n=1 Tax=Modicisalibacter xianhensis TaxID=442341 RepID=A0A4R8G0A6_9GAMM|nr:TRAP transporter substrate-binding protein [Halomonas xianhensis]TDX29382.1 tripartite ATP-independent transporter DctP family solute receptor [Halomonas xianhensis]